MPNSHCTKLIGLFFGWVPVAGPRTYAATAWLSGLLAPKAHSMRRYGTAAGIGKDARREGRGHSWRQSIRGNNVRGADIAHAPLNCISLREIVSTPSCIAVENIDKIYRSL